jgi:putative ABC transport system permease protein
MVQVLTTNLTPTTAQRFHFKEADENTVWKRFAAGDAIVSEAFAFKHHVRIGSTVELATDVGLKRFRVCGIYYEYASDIGIVVLERQTFNAAWHDRSNSGISIFLKNGMNTDSAIHSLRRLTEDRQTLLIRSNRALLASSLEIFDRTFAITDVLRLLTILVSFVGVLSALMALQFEKAREIAVLRANGITPREVAVLTTLQTALIGLIAGLLALPVGIILALVLIFVINQRSFGWTLQLHISLEILLQALLLAIVAAVLAGVYPAWKTSRTAPALALREE